MTQPKPRARMFHYPPLTCEALQDIADKRSKGVTWLALSQQYRMPAGVLQWRFQKANRVSAIPNHHNRERS